MTKLIYENGIYFTTSYKPRCEYQSLDIKSIRECFEFAYDMTFAEIGYHNKNGRSTLKVFNHVLRGKLAEVFFYNYSMDNNIPVSEIDFGRYKKGVWDDGDFTIKDKKIEIKSLKSYSNLLLLNQEKIFACLNNNGNSNLFLSDYYVVIKVSPDIEPYLNSFFCEDIETIEKEELWGKIEHINFACSIVGYFNLNELKTAINEKQFIEKGSRINSPSYKPLTTDFVYVSSDDFKPIKDFKIELVKDLQQQKNTKQR